MKRIIGLSVIFLLILYKTAYPAFEEKSASSRALAMGGAGVGLVDDIFSIYLNPAGLAMLDSKGFGATYTTLFGLEELRYSNLVYGQGLGRSSGLGLAFDIFGRVIYEERGLFLAYSHRILPRTYLGGNLKFMELSIETVGKGSSLGFDLGLLHEFGKRLNIGLSLRNINRPHIGDDLPSKVTCGLGIRPMNGLILALDYGITKTPLGEIIPCLRIGSEFELEEYLLLRAGFQGEKDQASLGFGIKNSYIRFDYAFLTHHILGSTHEIGIIFYLWKR